MLALTRGLVVGAPLLAKEAVRVMPAKVVWVDVLAYAPPISKRLLRSPEQRGRHAPDRAFVGHRLSRHSEGA